jgi:hypothetical protein
LTIACRNDIVNAALEAIARNNDLDFKSQDVNITFSLNLRNSALLFGNVDVKSRKNISDVSLELQAETLRAEVDLLRFVLHREVKIKTLLARNGQLRLRLAPRRSVSSDAAPRTSDVEALLYGLNRVQLERCGLSVENISGGSIAVDAQTLSADVEQKSERLTLRVKGLLAVQTSEGQKSAQRTSTNISVDVRGNILQGVATVTDSKLSVDGIPLEAAGSIAFRPLGEVSLTVTGKNLSLERIVSQIRKYAALDAPERLSGRADATACLTGSLKEKASLRLSVRGAARSVALKLKGAEEIGAKKLRCDITGHDVKKLQSYVCNISSDDASYSGFRFSGSGAIRNFTSPLYDASVNFSGDVAALKIANLPEGKVQGAAKVRAKGWSCDGLELLDLRADVSNLKALLQKEVYTLNGQLAADKNVLEPQLSISCAAAECTFSGAVQGYLTALLGKSEEAATLKIRGNLSAKRLNLDKLLAQGDSSASGLDLYASLNVQADELTALDYLYKNVSGAVACNARSLTISKLSAEAFGGALGGDVKLHTAAGGSSRLGCDLYFNNVKLESLPYLSKKLNIKPGSMQGSCNGAITLASNVNREGLDMDNLSAVVNFTVSNGRLLAFEPVQPLSAYLKKSLLQDVRFSALQNTIRLEKGKITIPKMEVRSTALNVLIAGTQELKGDFDYHIMLYLNELLSRKEKNIDSPIKENKTKLFLRFTSKNGVTEVTHDAQEWGKNMGEKAQREAQEVKNLLRNGQKADKNPQATAQKPEKIAVEWDEDENVGASEKTAQKPEKPKPEKPTQKKQRSKVEVEWEE